MGEEAVRQRLRLQQARGRGGRAEVTVRVRVRGDGGRGARAHPNKLRSPIATHVCFFSSRAVRASTYSECPQLRCVCGPLTTSCALCAPAKSSDSPCPRVLDIRVSTRQYVCGSCTPGHPSPDARNGRVGSLPFSPSIYVQHSALNISGGAHRVRSAWPARQSPASPVRDASSRFFNILRLAAYGIAATSCTLHTAYGIQSSRVWPRRRMRVRVRVRMEGQSGLGARSSGCATLVDITYCSVQRLLTYSRPSTSAVSSPAPRARALCPVLASLRCQGQQTQCVPLMGHLPSGCRNHGPVLGAR